MRRKKDLFIGMKVMLMIPIFMLVMINRMKVKHQLYRLPMIIPVQLLTSSSIQVKRRVLIIARKSVLHKKGEHFMDRTPNTMDTSRVIR